MVPFFLSDGYVLWFMYIFDCFSLVPIAMSWTRVGYMLSSLNDYNHAVSFFFYKQSKF
jgi:hypothetical protein